MYIVQCQKNAFGFTCGDCNWQQFASEMGASLQPYCRLAMTAVFCHEFYKAGEKFENSDIRRVFLFYA
jgi:hypothetical protein